MTELTGIDISYAQATTPPLGAYAFVCAKACQADFIDSRWAQHSTATRAAGKPLGSYCFGVSGQRTPVADQVALFLKTAHDADFLVLDLEHDSHFAVSMSLAEAREFVSLVQVAGRKIGLYHSRSGFPDVGQDWNWVADYSDVEPSLPHLFWQYTSTPIDHNKFHGDEAALAAFLADQRSDMNIIRVKSDDFTPTGTGGQVFVAPVLSAAKIVDLPAGTVLRSVAEVKGNDGGNYRLVEYKGQAGYLCIAKPDGSPGWWKSLASAEADALLNAVLGRQSLYTAADVKAAALGAAQSQYDLDAKSISASATAHLTNARPS